jgi:hypothetical protein
MIFDSYDDHTVYPDGNLFFFFYSKSVFILSQSKPSNYRQFLKPKMNLVYT